MGSSRAVGSSVERRLLATIALSASGLLGVGCGIDDENDMNDSPQTTAVDAHPLSESSCREEAAEVMAQFPGVYDSEDQYVQICSTESRDLYDDLAEDPP